MAKLDVTFKEEGYTYNLRGGALIIKDNKILLTHNIGEESYFLPGGRISLGCDSKESLIREIEEEEGIKLTYDEIELKAILEVFFKLSTNHHQVEFIYSVDSSKFDTSRYYDVLDKVGIERAEWYTLEEVKNMVVLPIAIDELLGEGINHLIIKNRVIDKK